MKNRFDLEVGDLIFLRGSSEHYSFTAGYYTVMAIEQFDKELEQDVFVITLDRKIESENSDHFFYDDYLNEDNILVIK
jgi:hypothetical protein